MSCGSTRRIRVVTVGGGTGSSVLLRGLKRYADRIDITAIVTTFDDGGSSGKLRNEFGVPALGDIRRCIAALLPPDREDSTIGWMLEHRLTSDGLLNDHSLGNLMLLSAWQRSESLSEAIDSIADSFNLIGRVVPVSDEPSDLCAELEDGELICGESAVGERNEDLFGSSRIYLDPPVMANPDALVALREADVVILGPGDLFASVIPNLLPDGVIEAISESSGRILQVCNIAAKPGETVGYTASDFVKSVNRYLESGRKGVDAILVDEQGIGSSKADGAIAIDDSLSDIVEVVTARNLSDDVEARHHDSDRLAAAVLEYVDAVIGYR